ncbi:bacteriocin [Okeania hirsuta]|uniref:bacteriocin n=1 Tax=Okeania hirsuta TaxID=1458930 RepID=UPI0018649DD0|nr:bacteriocin [Okeania hirsuta]
MTKRKTTNNDAKATPSYTELSEEQLDHISGGPAVALVVGGTVITYEALYTLGAMVAGGLYLWYSNPDVSDSDTVATYPMTDEEWFNVH